MVLCSQLRQSVVYWIFIFNTFLLFASSFVFAAPYDQSVLHCLQNIEQTCTKKTGYCPNSPSSHCLYFFDIVTAALFACVLCFCSYLWDEEVKSNRFLTNWYNTRLLRKQKDRATGHTNIQKSESDIYIKKLVKIANILLITVTYLLNQTR